MAAPCLALRVDDPQNCWAGSWLTGRVYVVLPANVPPHAWQGIHVRLAGYEVAVVTSASGQQEQKKHVIMCTEQAIGRWSSTNVPSSHPAAAATPGEQHLEYPFRWRIPAHLPDVLHCRRGKATTKEDHCRIIYPLTAHLVSLGGRAAAASDTVLLHVRQRPVARAVALRPVTVPVQSFPITTALVVAQGQIAFGLELSTDTLVPGTTGSTTLDVRIRGRNHCRHVAVRDFSVKLVERVQWTVTPGQGDKDGTNSRVSQQQERLLTSQKIRVRDCADWQAGAGQGRNYVSGGRVATAQLSIPAETLTRRTYRGKLIQVTHHVVVVCETATDWTTNPKLTWPVRLLTSGRPATALPTAFVLPSTDWCPTAVAPVTELPAAGVIPHAQAHVVAAAASGDATSTLSCRAEAWEE
jgi:hypothetical protein